jgi:acyl-CoA synthetase (NDP forming)
LLGFFTYTAGTPSTAPKLRKELQRVREKHPDRLFVLSLLAAPEWVQTYEEDGFTVFEDPHRAVAAIAAMHTFGKAFARGQRQAPPSLQGLQAPGNSLNEAQAKRWLAQAGIQCAPEEVCLDADSAVEAAQRLGYPVVLKIVSPDILHKSEIGGVLLNIDSPAQVREGYALLMQRARAALPDAKLEGVLVARQLSGGVECIMGLTQDPVFGPVAMFGLGGIFVEVLKDVVFHRCPFGPDVAEAMIRSIRGAPLLLGARGKPAVDIEALAQMLSRLSAVGDVCREQVLSIDLNPVLAMPQGQGAFAVDAVVEMKPH